MLKPPSTRVPCIADVALEVLDEILADCRWAFQPITLIPIKDFQVFGSAACDRWQFHSDLDFNVVTGMPRDATLQLWQGKERPQAQEVVRRANQLSRKWGMKFQFTFEHPEGAQHVAAKSCYSLVEKRHYHPESKDRVDIDPVTGSITTRRLPFPGRFNWSVMDDEGVYHANQDPYPKEEVERWAKRYGRKFQRIGDTPDTAYLKR